MTLTTKTALFALLAMWGVGTTTLPSFAEDAVPTEAEADAADAAEGSESSLTDRVWVRADAGDDLPGPMQVFLSDGTLVTDSCWETYRLSAWKQVSDSQISWNEDGMDINAEIVTLTANELVLKLQLGSEAVENRYVAAAAPYVCPDMPR